MTSSVLVFDNSITGLQTREIPSATLAAPRAEVAAWRWAVNNAITWTKAMQKEMYRGAQRYAPLASADERDEITTLV
jgi:hypothetical protein